MTVNEGAIGDQVLAIDLAGNPEDHAGIEIIDPMKDYREWNLPAKRINEDGKVRLLTEEEVDAIEDANFLRRHGGKVWPDDYGLPHQG